MKLFIANDDTLTAMIVAPYGQIPGSFPYGIGYAYGPNANGAYLCPSDPQFNQNGEQGLYYDTALGGARKPSIAQRIKRSLGLGSSIPTDAELASVYGYTPVNAGWIPSNQGFITGPWTPPNGYQPAGAFGPPVSLNGLRDAAVMPQATPNDLIMALNDHNQRMFTLAVVSTVVAGVAAVVTLYRATKGLRGDD